jgi:hypothetical protein
MSIIELINFIIQERVTEARKLAAQKETAAGYP